MTSTAMGAATRPLVVAIDGPAASGKGTIARRIAAARGFAYLDTGQLYRAVAARMLCDGRDPCDGAAAADAARRLDPADLERLELRSPEVGSASSVVAAHSAVRAALLETQRAFAARPPEGADGAVLDGRDIGTVVCPEADAKLFVTATLDVRAARRARELAERCGGAPDPDLIARVRADLVERDRRDSARATAPLRRAEDALLLDTSDLDIDAAVARAESLIDERFARQGK